MLSRVFTSSALLNEPSRAAHALNAIGLCAKVAIIFGVNPMFLVIASRVGLESAGTWSCFRAALLGIVVFRKLRALLILIRDPAHRRPDGAASAPSFPDAPAPRTSASPPLRPRPARTRAA